LRGTDSDFPKIGAILVPMKKPREVIQPRWRVYALRVGRNEG
jgi:hypothetical protein